MKAYTDAPFEKLGDLSVETVPTRQVEVLDYDGQGTCQVFVEGEILKVKVTQLYKQPSLSVGIEVPTVACVLVFCHVCGRPAVKLNPKGQGTCAAHSLRPLAVTNPTQNKKVGRNDPCPCGQFGLKFKNCCGKPVPNKVPKPVVFVAASKKLGEEPLNEAENS